MVVTLPTILSLMHTADVKLSGQNLYYAKRKCMYHARAKHVLHCFPKNRLTHGNPRTP